MFNAKKFLEDYRIEYIEHGPNWQPGWVQIKCVMPGCEDTSSHGGFNLTFGNYSCWKCGKHKLTDVISELIGTSKKDSWQIIQNYNTNVLYQEEDKKKKSVVTSIELPFGTGGLRSEHKRYLKNRNFNPDKIANEWRIKGTGHRGFYKFRIIAPVYLNHRLVSYQGRDITDKQEQRYKACNTKNEIVHHKHTLYGIDHIKNRRCIVVEGITDVWRLGYGAVGTFGTEFTIQQVLMLKEKVDTCFLMFDTAAVDKMNRLDMLLQSQDIETEQIEFTGFDDPGEMDDLTAKRLMKRLGV